MNELDQLKYWMDAEFTIIHIMLYIILGLLIGGWFWWLAGVMIAFSVYYIVKRTIKLPKDYLKVK